MRVRWLALLVLVAGGAALASGPAALVRLGPPERFVHCTIGDESRPATACAAPRLVASHKGRRIPAGGRLRVPLGRLPEGADLVLDVEAYVYAAAPRVRFSRIALRGMTKVLAVARRPAALSLLVGAESGFERVPPVLVRPDPGARSIDLRLPAAHAGRRVAYAVWAWSPSRGDVALPLVASAADGRLTLAAGVQELAAGGLGAATFEAQVVDAGSGRRVKTLWRRTLDPAAAPADRGWHETTVDVGAWADGASRVELRVDGPGAGLARWARPILRFTTASEERHPNLLLLSLDTLRADHVGAYGQARATTPRLDALAARSVLFERAYAPFPSTTASHMTMLTAMLPCAHGVTVPDGRLPPGIPTLAELLAARGYATLGITEDALIKGDAGFNRGFDRYRDLPPEVTLGVFHTGIALAEQWLSERGAEPFFLFLHTYQVHTPYKIPPHLRGLFTAPATAPEWEREMADYDVGLRYADELLGGFLDDLQRRGLLDETVLVVTSDHGTEFGERGGIGHAKGVHREQLQVPMLVRHPAFAPRRVGDVVGVVDVTPTLLEMGGVAATPAMAGRSLVPFLRGGSLPPREAIGEQLWGPRQTALRDASHTWIAAGAGTALFDRRDDPWEQRDRTREEPELAARGSARIAEFRERCQAESRSLTAPVNLDPERARALRALGYVQ